MKINELFAGISHRVVVSFDGEITQVVYDSRAVQAGALFVCLRGLTVDGHDFIDRAVAAGAVAVLVEDGFTGEVPSGIGVISVENTRSALAYVSANLHDNPAEKLRLVGVTGTNGKTTTTYFIEEVLRACGRKTGIIGTTGIRALGEAMDIAFATSTTPDPPELHRIFAEMARLGVRDVVMEVSSHALAFLKMEGLTFDVGVFTNLTQDHLDFHGTMENYMLAKAKLFAQSRIGVINTDCPFSGTMVEHMGGRPHFSYGLGSADLQAIHTERRADGSSFTLGGEEFSLPVSGKFNVYNALAAIGAAKALGIEMPKIRKAVANLSGVPGRIQAVPNARGLNVFVDYAHSPDGLENIINSVRETTKGRVITLFGCGGDRDKTKRPIMGKIAATLSDFCILTSDNPRTENPMEILAQVEGGVSPVSSEYKILENRRDAIFAGVKMLTPDDALIIAGKGHEDYQIIGTTKHHFDDFETAAEALEN
ncbi:MAG: UDP-N-acetylmuramoyl-L-alanyl-D-glutamate--2,6-diaminopimelate ligase [Defluviitaleaceae bacterium]|nr:UDP-N-acetylmuramoyl-L-alanyl-D-glutamate--2,6-diaminopimelate ligase [Defluviitaleaceae bacterium]